MAIVMERMASRPKNNPLPQMRQEEPQHNEALASGQNPPPQRRREEPRPMCDQAGGQNP